MTDLTAILPDFPTHQYVRILPSLEKHRVTTADLLTLDGLEIAKRAQVPILDVKRLCKEVLETLQGNLGITGLEDVQSEKSTLRKTGEEVFNSWNTISTLDDDLDRALGGGIPTGSITEITGESGAGKTQFLLTLLLSTQLPAPQGLSSATLYISTESALPVTRLRQMLLSHPTLSFASPKPSLNRIISIVTPDLESQDHILHYQVPVAIKRHNIRLVILDSVAANYRAEFERGANGAVSKSATNMARRSSELVRLGQMLRDLAREMNIAVVVANQVADRFYGTTGAVPSPRISGEEPGLFQNTSDPMSLDHQQRWFTGWGDDPHPSHLTLKSMKTPSLGLIWTTQIACRIALIKRPVYGPGVVADELNEMGEPVLRRWRRWMKVVFAGHVESSGPGLEGAVMFEIKGQGIVAVKKGKEKVEEGDYEAAGS